LYFQLRGDEAIADQQFVNQLATQANILHRRPLILIPKKYAADKKYPFKFYGTGFKVSMVSVLKSVNKQYDVISLAHHQKRCHRNNIV